MVRSPSLSANGSKATQRIASGVLSFIFAFVVSIFPGLCINGAQSSWGTLDEKPTLEFVRQGVSKENAAYRFNPEKREEEPPFLSFIIEGKKKEFRKFALGKGKSKSKAFPFLNRESDFVSKNLWFEFTAQTELSHQVTHLNLCSQPRAPPYIL